MPTSQLTGFLLIGTIALVVLFRVCRKAGEGWEDESGFHFSATDTRKTGSSGPEDQRMDQTAKHPGQPALAPAGQKDG